MPSQRLFKPSSLAARKSLPQRRNPAAKAAMRAADATGNVPSSDTFDTSLPLLGGLSARQFMRRYWQRKPLLIRQALGGAACGLAPEQLLALASDEDIEARLIQRKRKAWSLTPGPFEPELLESLPARAWTVLLQGVNLVDAEADALLRRFRFIADARLDDVMVSYAVDGGGVGPHFDSYDVFLLQTSGRRRWRISTQSDLTLEPGQPLKILQDFRPEQEWVLEAGDMLYLPPHIAHDGVAVGDDCVTYSIGFRAPAYRELLGEFFHTLAERIESGEFEEAARNQRTASSIVSGRYQDAGALPTAAPAELPPRLVDELATRLLRVECNSYEVSTFLGTYLSEPKPQVFFDGPQRPLSLERFIARSSARGLQVDSKSILLYDARNFYMNGDTLQPPRESRAALRTLANSRRMSSQSFVTFSNDSSLTLLLHGWYLAGWIRVA
ncbi:MAG: JmjC domain-containing protein [Janthinobacterium lividum]